jgi:nucleoside-diphosphate-sugar epimerase
VIVVAGGSGFIGAAVVRRLVAQGEDVAVMTAHPERSRGRIEGLGARLVHGDILDPPSLQPAVAGAHAVIQTLTFPSFPVQRPRRRYTYEEFDHLGTERLAKGAAAAGVARFVYCSGTGAAPDAPEGWFRAKGSGEQAVRRSGLEHVILRPSWVYGPDDRALNSFVAFHRWLPFVPVIGDGRQRLQPVFVEDVAEAHAQAAKAGGPTGTFEIGGPDVMEMNDVLHQMMEVRGRRKPLVHFPPFLPKLAAFFLQFMPKPLLSPEAVDLVTADAVADTGPLMAAFDLRLTPLREGLRSYLSR